MTPEEYDEWFGRASAGTALWVIDPMTWFGSGDILAYRGLETGFFAHLQADGTLKIGSYHGAVPHIGHAKFVVAASKKYATIEEAGRALVTAGRMHFLGADIEAFLDPRNKKVGHT